MENLAHIVLLIILGFAFYQDWKFRAISWLVFPLLGLVAFSIFYLADVRLLTLVFNLFFLTCVLACLVIYVSIQRGKLTNIFKADLGLGDVLFLLAISPLFMDRNYILFFITGMLFSGIIHIIVFMRNKSEKIPLAGYLALYLIGLKTVDLFTASNLFYTPVL